MAKTQRKKNWGGKRPGAGRPGEGRVTVCTRIRVELKEQLSRAVSQRNITLSRLIEELLSTDQRVC
jgi:hypothetical protein